MLNLDPVIAILSDGKWHNVTTIRKKLGFTFEQLDRILNFLNKYGIVEVSEDLLNVRLEEAFKELPLGSHNIEKKGKHMKMRIKSTPMFMNIFGQFETLEVADNQLLVTGKNLKIARMGESKEPAIDKEGHMIRLLEKLVNQGGYKQDSDKFFRLLWSYEDAASLLLERVNLAKARVWLATRFTNELIINALMRRANEGVDVKIIAGMNLIRKYISDEREHISSSHEHTVERIKTVVNPWHPGTKVKRRVTDLPFTFVIIDNHEVGIEIPDVIEPDKFNIAIYVRDENSIKQPLLLFEKLWSQASEDIDKLVQDLLKHTK